MQNQTGSPQFFTFPSSHEGQPIHAATYYPPTEEPIAIIQLVHGLSEHIGRYADLAEHLASQGYLVVGHDHLGHGKTAEAHGTFGFFSPQQGWNHVVNDVATLQQTIAQQYPTLPYLLLGHSMGSFIARTYLLTHSQDIDGCILSGTGQQPAPLLLAGYTLARLLRKIKGGEKRSPFLYNLSMGAYNRSFHPNRTTADWISRDEAYVDNYLSDPMCQFSPTIGMFHDLFFGLRIISKAIPKGTIPKELPIYLFSGEKDPVGDFGKGVQRVYDGLIAAGVANVSMKLYENGRHEMHHETNKEEVISDLLQWMNAVIEKQASLV